jgi:hypothetical protein
MKNTHLNVGFLGLISYLVLVGCANDPHFSPPPTAEVRAALGRVAVQSASSVTNAGVEKPYTPGKAAAAGAMEAISGMGSSGGDFAGIAIVILPIAALVGGTVGGMRGTPEAEAQAEWQVLSNACATLDFQRALRRDVIMAMGKYTRVPVVQAGRSGVSTQRTADTLLELSVLQAGLAGKNFKNSPMTVFLTVQARLVRLSDGQELYKHVWMQTGSKKPYSLWASRDASLFRKELAYACRNVAVQMVREMFLAQPSRKKAWWL